MRRRNVRPRDVQADTASRGAGAWSLAFVSFMAMASAGLAACGAEGAAAPDASAPACTPSCDARACGSDGCGGVCGACAAPATCSADGQCVTNAPDACDKSCAELGFACGDHCGNSCGTCTGAQESCVANKCTCGPSCSVETCEQVDGCDGKCPACPRDVSCSDCPLTLSVVDREIVDGRVRSVTVALDFAPKLGTPLPGMADLRLRVLGDAELAQVAIGESLITSEKGFYMDPETGRAYRELADGTLQLLIMSTNNTRDIPAGRWLFLTFRFAPSFGADASVTPLILALVEREEIFAPAAADAALWGSHFGASLVVWPDAVEVNHAP